MANPLNGIMLVQVFLKGLCYFSTIFLVYINDLAEDLVSDVRLFADDISLCSVVYDAALKFTEKWAYQLKMQFNPDKNKQAIQVIFSHRKSRPIHPLLNLNGNEIATFDEHKHLGFFFDFKLSSIRQTKEILIKACRGVGIIRFMFRYLSRDVLD